VLPTPLSIFEEREGAQREEKAAQRPYLSEKREGAEEEKEAGLLPSPSKERLEERERVMEEIV